jgi:hypothetical protein
MYVFPQCPCCKLNKTMLSRREKIKNFASADRRRSEMEYYMLIALKAVFNVLLSCTFGNINKLKRNKGERKSS